MWYKHIILFKQYLIYIPFLVGEQPTQKAKRFN